MSRCHKLKTCAFVKVVFWVILLNVLFFPEKVDFVSEGNNRFTISMNGIYVGVTDNPGLLYDYYGQARRELSRESDSLVLTDVPVFSISGEEVLFGGVDSKESIIANMKDVLSSGDLNTFSEAYTVKVNGTLVSLADSQQVVKFLDDAIDVYDKDDQYYVSLGVDSERELSVLTASVNRIEKAEEDNVLASAGAALDIEFENEEIEAAEDVSFDSFDYGVTTMYFSEPIEIVEAFVPETDIISAQEAGNILTCNQEVQQIYKVQSGDTLSEISLSVGLPLDDIIALNDSLENENSMIRVDQELIITVPEPELSVCWAEDVRIEEAYNLPIEYIYNDSWYTNQKETLQQPSAGYHDAVQHICHRGDDITATDTLYEEVIMEPVAKIVEVGTIVPPTYIKPISGGRLSSGFGRRSAPVRGASTYHKGIDWATPIGTSVYASSGGTVAVAGWGSGYGYCVYINHPDGRQTRYGHLSRVYVSAGQYVSQGQLIAASGNTGRSSGPHLHFEILINGVQVNPLDYL